MKEERIKKGGGPGEQPGESPAREPSGIPYSPFFILVIVAA
jgi:hypothetical protein